MLFEIVVTSQYGILSNGRHSARTGTKASPTWAKKNSKGQLVITEAGVWLLHCSDGFNRTAKATITVEANGDWEMTGDTKRFNVI